MYMSLYVVYIVLSTVSLCSCALPEKTRWKSQHFDLEQGTEFSVNVVLRSQSQIRLKIDCGSEDVDESSEKLIEVRNLEFEVRWLLRRSSCTPLFKSSPNDKEVFELFHNPKSLVGNENYCEVIGRGLSINSNEVESEHFMCGEPVFLQDLSGMQRVRIDKDNATESYESRDNADIFSSYTSVTKENSPFSLKNKREFWNSYMHSPLLDTDAEHVIYSTEAEGPYSLIVEIKATSKNMSKYSSNIQASYNLELISVDGYLSALDDHLLYFFAFMCFSYSTLCILWMMFAITQWRNMLRVQYWIGVVIGLGLMEQAFFVAQYDHINSSGQLSLPLHISAELFSVAKRTLACVLLLFVSFGYGLVKARLGSLQRKVSVFVMFYFIFATIDALQPIFGSPNQSLITFTITKVPLVALNALVYCWCFSSLVKILKNLEVRRTESKLLVYKQFFNTLLFCVLANLVYFVWYVQNYVIPSCITNWQNLWIEKAFGQLEFFLVLTVVVFLWRPSLNVKHYESLNRSSSVSNIVVDNDHIGNCDPLDIDEE